MELAPSVVLRLAPGVRLRTVADGSTVLLAAETIIRLNDSAADVVARVNGERSVQQIIDSLAADYVAAPDQLPADVNQLLQSFCERGFLLQ